MSKRFWIAVIVLCLASSSFAKDIYIPIAGAVQGANNTFFITDARIFNPSFTKDITISATYHQRSRDNSGATPITITVPKRQQLVLNDIVRTRFNAGDLGSIRFRSDDDFVVTSRTYTASNCTAPAGGTFGQFVSGFGDADLLTKGVIIQLSYNSDLTRGFRSNIGFASNAATATTITAKLFDSTNTQVGTTATITLQPFDAQILNMSQLFQLPTLNTDNAWVSFTASQPVFAYGSTVDNQSADQVFVAARADSGVEPTGPNLVTVNITATQFEFIINGQRRDSFTVKKGDRVTLNITSDDVTHGFAMSPFVASLTLQRGDTETVTFDANTAGSFGYFCTISSCGSGHFSMSGTMVVQP